MKTKAFLRSRDQRKRVEIRFAHLKTHHTFERLRLRGRSGARDEFHRAAIVQNLKMLAGRLFRPPPAPAFARVVWHRFQWRSVPRGGPRWARTKVRSSSSCQAILKTETTQLSFKLF